QGNVERSFGDFAYGRSHADLCRRRGQFCRLRCWSAERNSHLLELPCAQSDEHLRGLTGSGVGETHGALEASIGIEARGSKHQLDLTGEIRAKPTQPVSEIQAVDQA